MQHFLPPASLSYWERETFFRGLDVAIIGSGIVGLSAAIELKERKPNWKIAVLERGVLPFGASTRNAGFACFGSMTELLDDLQTQSEEEVWALVERRWQGLQQLRARIGDKNLGYEPFGGYELFQANEANDFQECLANIAGFNAKVEKITGFPNAYQVATEKIPALGFKGVNQLIINQLEGQIHTGRMMASLLQLAATRGIRLLNGIEIKHLASQQDMVSIHTMEGWEIQATRALVTTNGFAQQLLPDLAIQPARNQVLITKPIANLPVKGAFHYDKGYFYFRNVGDRILLGGGRNLAKAAEQTTAFGTTTLIQSHLEKLLREVILPEQSYEIDTWWSGIMGVGDEKSPIIQEVMPNITVAVRLGGMGVAIGSLVGAEAAQLILSQ